LLAAFSLSVPDGDRILILEDAAELHIRMPYVISAEAQIDTHKNQIGFADLLKAALRHRPDRIIVGEIRGPEARVFLDALNTGHRGSLTTIHAKHRRCASAPGPACQYFYFTDTGTAARMVGAPSASSFHTFQFPG
jgi:Flp pilus assembly CpaF family ATPase